MREARLVEETSFISEYHVNLVEGYTVYDHMTEPTEEQLFELWEELRAADIAEEIEWLKTLV